jgi:hypothetical protein
MLAKNGAAAEVPTKPVYFSKPEKPNCEGDVLMPAASALSRACYSAE